ncbi:MAG: helix-turn-helix transcriptional regulator [Thermoguttaceae bacterium]|jgi:lambda repressor-like predicted transcriptional regulator
MATLSPEIEKLTLLQAATFLRAYLECSDEIQAGIRDLLEILNDPNTEEDDHDMTLITLANALFPNPRDAKLGMDLGESENLGTMYSQETRETLEETDREEERFATLLRSTMERQGITQEQLAAKIGVGQPAISNMLKRQCRPQRRTVLRLAEALGVAADDLWPGFKN